VETEITEADDESILVLAPVGRDAELASAALDFAGFHPVVCQDLRELIEKLVTTRGAVLVAEEALAPAAMPELTAFLRSQPPWSDLPIILLTSRGTGPETSPPALSLFGREGNVTLLERPIRVITLCSTVRVALRARRRQYEVRDLLQQREEVLASERAARAEAERAGRMKDEFLATLSHELRTPLNAIVGWCSLLQGGPTDDAELAQGLETIERNARSQKRIIEDLLDMSRIISGKIHLDVQRLDLAEVIQAAVDTVRHAADAKQISLRVVLSSDLGLVSGDPNRLQQVFWNLLTNAIKFTPKAGTVKVILRRVHSQAEVSVADSGDGIKAEFLPLVFDRFRQADSSSTRRHGGLGLGLAIVKQLVELHGGHVAARSAGAGLGATFIVTLPLAAVLPQQATDALPQEESASQSPSPEWNPGVQLSGIKLLVVDDEPDARDIVKRLLDGCGAEVRSAGSAAEALQLIQADPPDVLISDIGMPSEDGYSLIRAVRALPAEKGGAIPAVALTAYARSEDRVQVLRGGFQMHAVKPVEPAELLAMVASLVRPAKG
jgi:signal transduction histidine kinase/ActR/RegA family two-component response regulator